MIKKSKRTILIIAAIVLIAAAIAIVGLIAQSGSSDREYREHLELGNSYLNELEYEQAIIELRAAIEIEPNNSEAYLALSEVYVAMGDYENAIAVLQEGYAATGDEEIKKESDRLKQEYEALQESVSSTNQGNSITTPETEQNYRSELDRLIAEGADDMLRMEELTWFGNPAATLDYETAKALLLQNGFYAGQFSEQGGDEYMSLVDVEYGDGGTSASVLQYKSESTVGLVGFQHFDFYDGPVYTTEIRGITMRDPLETVLDKIGFSNADEIAAYIEQEQQAVYADDEEFYAATENNLWMRQENDETVIIHFQWSLEVLEGGGYRLGDPELHIDINSMTDGAVGGALWLSFDENNLLEDLSMHNN